VGRPYRPWIDLYLAGKLPPSFGADPEEGKMRLPALQRLLIQGERELAAHQRNVAGRADPHDLWMDVLTAYVRRIRALVDERTTQPNRSKDLARSS
jgi:hypothetical protein